MHKLCTLADSLQATRKLVLQHTDTSHASDVTMSWQFNEHNHYLPNKINQINILSDGLWSWAFGSDMILRWQVCQLFCYTPKLTNTNSAKNCTVKCYNKSLKCCYINSLSQWPQCLQARACIQTRGLRIISVHPLTLTSQKCKFKIWQYVGSHYVVD